MLHTSGFMDDVMPSHGANGLESKARFRRVRQVPPPGAKLPSTIESLLEGVVVL